MLLYASLILLSCFFHASSCIFMLLSCFFHASFVLLSCFCSQYGVCLFIRVGQSHVHMVCNRYFRQGNYQIYNHTWRIYTVLANPIFFPAWCVIRYDCLLSSNNTTVCFQGHSSTNVWVACCCSLFLVLCHGFLKWSFGGVASCQDKDICA